MADLSDAPGAILVQAVHDQTRGWQWVTETAVMRNRESQRRILVMMKHPRAAVRPLLPTSPFGAPPLTAPAEQFAVLDQVTHDKYGLGRVISVEDDTVLIVDFGSSRVRITTPCAKLTKL